MMWAVPIYESVVKDLNFRPAEVMRVKFHAAAEGGREIMIDTGNGTFIYFPHAVLEPDLSSIKSKIVL